MYRVPEGFNFETVSWDLLLQEAFLAVLRLGWAQPPTVLVPVACFSPTQIVTAFVFWLSHQPGNPTGHELLFVHLSPCFLLVCLFPGFPICPSIWTRRKSLVSRLSQALGLKRLSLCGFSLLQCLRVGSRAVVSKAALSLGLPLVSVRLGTAPLARGASARVLAAQTAHKRTRASVGPRPAPARCLLPPSPGLTTGFDESNPLSGWDLPQPAGQREGFPCRSRQAASAAGFSLC